MIYIVKNPFFCFVLVCVCCLVYIIVVKAEEVDVYIILFLGFLTLVITCPFQIISLKLIFIFVA